MEGTMLNALDFRLCAPTPFDFLVHFHGAAGFLEAPDRRARLLSEVEAAGRQAHSGVTLSLGAVPR